MIHLILHGGQLICHIQTVAKNCRQRMADPTHQWTVLCIRNTAHGIQCIVQKMWIDLRLKHLKFRSFYQHFVLQFLFCHCLNTVQHFIKLRSKHRQFLRPPDRTYTKRGLPIFDTDNGISHLLYRLCHPSGQHKNKQYDQTDHCRHNDQKCPYQ